MLHVEKLPKIGNYANAHKPVKYASDIKCWVTEVHVRDANVATVTTDVNAMMKSPQLITRIT